MKKTLLQRAPGYAGLANDLRKVARSKDETVKDNARRHLAQRMGKLHGLPQKIGQIMSMSSDETSAEMFAGLTDGAEPLAFDTVTSILESAWGGRVDTVVSEIDPSGQAASLGQVHQAKLHSGQRVAIKVAYPGIREAVMNDLKMLGWLSAPVGDLRKGFDLGSYRREVVRDLNEELDYPKELANQVRYRTLAASLKTVIVPEPIEQWSRSNVLVSTWEDGETIDEATRWLPNDREELARRILRHFLTMLFDHGVVHGDPHPGNYRFRLDRDAGPQIVLYDYGSVLTLSDADRLALLRLIADTASQRGDPSLWLTALGFDARLLDPIRAKLPAVCSVLFEPFAHPSKFDISDWKRTERLDDILADDRWNFRMAGPAKLILLMRAFRGLLYYLERLKAPISWERVLSPILSRHRVAIDGLATPATSGPSAPFSTMAKYLRIEVRRNGQRKVWLTMPGACVEDLSGIMDEDVIAKVTEQGVDLDAIVRDARRSGYAPMELFTLDDPEQDKTVRVWMD